MTSYKMATHGRELDSLATGRRPQTFAVLVFPGFPMMAFSSVIEPLRAANVLAKRQCYRWFVVGADIGPIRASNGIALQPDFAVNEAPRSDRSVVCSGGDADHLVAEAAVTWIRRSLRNGSSIGAVADAALFLAGPAFSTVTPALCIGPANPRSRRRFPSSTCGATSMSSIAIALPPRAGSAAWT
jgi:hypothetical protein